MGLTLVGMIPDMKYLKKNCTSRTVKVWRNSFASVILIFKLPVGITENIKIILDRLTLYFIFFGWEVAFDVLIS